MDAPPITDIVHKLLPTARAYVSIRLAPGDATQLAKTAVEEHLPHPGTVGAR